MRILPYGTWPSPITANLITSALVGFSRLKYDNGSYYWLEGRAQDGGRSVLVGCADGLRRDLTPEPLNVRSRVHEYGGGAYALSNTTAYVVNFIDQDIYTVDLLGSESTGAPVRVTDGDATERYGDLVWDPHRRSLIAVRERHGIAEEAVNDLVSIDVDTGAIEVLHCGHDFYSSASLSADGKRLAFIVWDHPNMPWDGTQLVTVALDSTGRTSSETVVAGGIEESIFQPEWIGSDRLLYVSDESGFWNLYCYDDSGVYNVVPDEAEYGLAQWSLGTTNFVAIGERHVVVQRIDEGASELVIVDIDTGMISPLPVDFTSYHSLTRTDTGVAFIAGKCDDVASVVELDIAGGITTALATQGDIDFQAGSFSTPETIRFESTGGVIAYANFYAPCHPDYTAADDELPPLVVMSHGGPTAAASRDLSFRIQYYTSRGWAVLDVNYGGSTGFGRAYRERLNGKWGVVDVDDCVAGVRHLASNGRIDMNRVAIRGGSAGGYTTLAALVSSNVFRAGASHYGIGDLAALTADTHKFESRYTYRLVDEADIELRSPIHHVERLSCPTIFFQGTDDRIVPPNQSETMFEALKAKGIPVAYRVFEGEGHGFRRAKNAKRAIEDEYLFFAKVFGFEPADDLPAIPVENATWT